MMSWVCIVSENKRQLFLLFKLLNPHALVTLVPSTVTTTKTISFPNYNGDLARTKTRLVISFAEVIVTEGLTNAGVALERNFD